MKKLSIRLFTCLLFCSFPLSAVNIEISNYCTVNVNGFNRLEYNGYTEYNKVEGFETKTFLLANIEETSIYNEYLHIGFSVEQYLEKDSVQYRKLISYDERLQKEWTLYSIILEDKELAFSSFTRREVIDFFENCDILLQVSDFVLIDYK